VTSAAALMPNGVLYFDSGSLSGSTPLVRCLTMRVRSEPCSEWASAGEQAKYPCPSDPSNTSKSSLQNIQPGDVLYDLAGSDQGNHEHMLVLAVVVNSPTSIDITVMREYGNSTSWQAEANVGSSYCCAHSPGWTPYAYITMQSAWFDSTSTPVNNPPPQPESPAYSGLHHDLGQGGPGLVNLAVPPAGIDDVPNVSFSQFLATPVTQSHNNRALWAGDRNDTLFDNDTQQSYPTHRQSAAPPLEQGWKADVTALNIGYGNPRGQVDDSGISRTVIKVPGFDTVYQITNPAPSHTANIKLVPYLMTMGVQFFKDLSGPTNCHTDPNGPNCMTNNSIGFYCEAYAQNECVDGSNAGNFYFAATAMYQTENCYSNNQTLRVPCLYPLWPMAGWIEQIRQVPMDFDGLGVRRLSMGWSLPLAHFTFYNWISSPDGHWGFFAANPVGQKTLRNATGSAWFAMKIPPWPDQPAKRRLRFYGEIDRTAFIPYRVLVPGLDGDSVRVAFGYGENGDPNKFYCTTRLERCWTSTNAVPQNPFVFNGEPQGRTDCNASCTVTIPAIPGRVVYYSVEHANGVMDPVQAVAIP
jgi:hypothetical protein